MTQDMVRALADMELTQVIAWVQDEQRVRAEQRKHDTIAKIKEMAGAAGISVSIHRKRGRPQKGKPEAATAGWPGRFSLTTTSIRRFQDRSAQYPSRSCAAFPTS